MDMTLGFYLYNNYHKFYLYNTYHKFTLMGMQNCCSKNFYTSNDFAPPPLEVAPLEG